MAKRQSTANAQAKRAFDRLTARIEKVGLTDINPDAAAAAQAFLRRHGRSWPYRKRPAGVRRGREGQCWDNALKLARKHPEFAYAETIVDEHIDHAFCVCADGFVVDPTWPASLMGLTVEPPPEYHGVAFNSLWVTFFGGVLSTRLRTASIPAGFLRTVATYVPASVRDLPLFLDKRWHSAKSPQRRIRRSPLPSGR
jgi:hypothetical protein